MKNTKKLLSLVLALLMIFTCTITAFASDENTSSDNNGSVTIPVFTETGADIPSKYEQTCPVIFVPGFISSDVYGDVNDPDTLAVFPSTDDIINVITEAFIPGLLNFAIDRDVDKLVVRVTDRVNDMFKYWYNEPTGDAKEGSGIIRTELTEASTDSRLRFSYDWRGDPMKIADELHEYIETVCQLSGSQQVALGCHSLGSAVALAYLTKYGNDRVAGMVLDSPACNGVAIIGNVLTGKVNLDADGIAVFLKEILGESEYEALVSSIIDIFASAGVLNLFTRFADEIIEALAPAVYRETVAPLLGSWLTFWSMLPDSEVENAKAYIFGDILKGQDCSAIISKIDNYTKTVRVNRTKTLKAFDDDSRFAIFSRYTCQTVPLIGSADLLGDTIIETKATSLGATTAPIGTYFSDEYLKGKDMKYISPDKTVDASTCLFPEKTWFIRDSGHFETGGVTEIYYDMFFFADTELTCDTADIGRFTYRDSETYEILEDTAVPSAFEKPSILKSIYNFAVSLVETIINLLKNMF